MDSLHKVGFTCSSVMLCRTRRYPDSEVFMVDIHYDPEYISSRNERSADGVAVTKFSETIMEIYRSQV